MPHRAKLLSSSSHGIAQQYCPWLAQFRFEYLAGMPDTSPWMQKRGTKASRRKQEVIMTRVCSFWETACFQIMPSASRQWRLAT